jgi:hypothetical protein
MIQEKIMEQSDDQTLFAWELDPNDIKADVCGPLATSPSMFRRCSDRFPVPDTDTPTPYSMTNKGLRIELPIFKLKDQRKGIAILQCSTMASFPLRITLPIVQVNHEEDGYFARDGRYDSSLNTASLNEIQGAIPKIIFMKQDPIRDMEWRSPFRIRQWHMPQEYYKPRYSSPRLVAARTDIGDQNTRTFFIPFGEQRGAIIYGGIGFHVLVLFSIEMQHQRHLSCKILQLYPLFDYLDASPQYNHVQELLFVILGYVQRYSVLSTESDHDIDIVAQQISKLHGYYTTGSNSRKSFAYLTQRKVMSAIISPQVIDGQRTLVLDIKIHKLPEEECPFEEMEGGEAKQMEGFEAKQMEGDGEAEYDEDKGIDEEKREAEEQ